MTKEMPKDTAHPTELSVSDSFGESKVRVTDNTSTEEETIDKSSSDDQYPHGLKLSLLAGASVVSVFLIALDQVRIITP